MKIIIAGSCDIGLCILQEGGCGGLVGGYLKTEGEGQVQKCIRLGLSQKILKREEGQEFHLNENGSNKQK